ncbi:S8 family peptidase [Streptomyces sp. AK02-01A]|uniref:S8 family peptidase n=1 Tax=Streptomyces sp. AK02-01A TaxID=3028648 RepID=UPI0029B8F41D|nr:S8 family serine peptidase [Streptomyces sp. AK02-01A]MDX3853944.1 S8 family serine peptidase [Streptomyces sp. AK02-01A]
MKSSRTRWTVLATAGAVLLALAEFSPASATAGVVGATSSATTTGPTGTHSVTLITGDVVTTRRSGAQGGTVSVRRSDGSPSDARVIESGEHLYVYPATVLPYIASGALDKRLFDVTGLVADGYDDAHRDQLPLIVSYTDAAARSRGTALPEGARKVRELSSVHGAALSQDRRKSSGFWKSVTSIPDGARSTGTPAFGGGISRIWLDGRVKADLADTTAQIGAPEVWAGGDTGAGVDVAVLDTGVDTDHPDLAGRLAATASFVPDQDVTDRNGHGTHVASTIAGTGAASDGKEKGVAPGARLRVGKVLGNEGSGQDSWVLAGMEWAARDQHAKIISMSLGADPTDGSDPLSQAVDNLSAETGALFVIAAGNAGSPHSISAPGAADAALTVGAVDSGDSVADFSSQGPRLGDEGIKPEITAPGVEVLAARSQYAPEGEGSYQSLSGTSMATPHVAGAAALLAAAHPELTGRQLKDALVSSSKPTPAWDAYQGGNGRLDAAAAVRATVLASGTVSAPRAGAGDSGPAERPVTYTNTTGTPVTLDLTVDAEGAPADLFTLSRRQVVVPAHGTADVTVTIDRTPAGTSDHYSGQIRATGQDGVVLAHTAVALGSASHKLTLVVKDATGAPASGLVELLRAGEYQPDFYSVGDTGRADLYLPEDHYSAMGFMNVRGVHGPHSLGMALLGNPDIALDQDATVVLDASAARRVDATTPQETATTYQRFEYFRSMGGGSWRSFLETTNRYDSLWAQPTDAKVAYGDFYLTARWRKEQPALTVATGKTDFTDLLRQSGTTQLPKGHQTLPVVFAGDGADADYADLRVRGKAVVVRRNASVTDVRQAAAAATAGAGLLLVQNNEDGLTVRDYYADFQTPSPIEVALLGTDEGEELIRQARGGHASLRVVSQPVSDYVYDLVETQHNKIPRDLIQRETKASLARVDVGFNSPDPTQGGGEFRFDWPSYSDWGIGTTTRVPVNGKRTDWVSTGGSYRWGQEAYVDGLMYEIAPRTSHEAGRSSRVEWFKPIQRPYLNNNFKLPARSGARLSFDIPGWGSSDHVGMAMDYQRMRQTLALSQGTTELARGTGTIVAADAPGAGTLPYRLVVENEQDASVTPYSAKTRTEWDFRSKAPAGEQTEVPPLLQLDYAVDTDAAGKVGSKAELSVSAAHLPGASGAGKVEPVTLKVSYDDGKTWQTASRERPGHFSLKPPKKARFVSLRATARDTAGNAVTQTVMRAFGIR